MFKNMKVGTRLIAGFLFLSILAAIVGAIGIANMSKINDKAEEVYQKELLGLSYIKEANINVIDIGRAIRNLLLASSVEERDKFADSVEKAQWELKSNLDKARPLFYTPEGRKAFADFDRSLPEYEVLIPEAVKRARSEPLQENRETVQLYLAHWRPRPMLWMTSSPSWMAGRRWPRRRCA